MGYAELLFVIASMMIIIQILMIVCYIKLYMDLHGFTLWLENSTRYLHFVGS